MEPTPLPPPMRLLRMRGGGNIGFCTPDGGCYRSLIRGYFRPAPPGRQNNALRANKVNVGQRRGAPTPTWQALSFDAVGLDLVVEWLPANAEALGWLQFAAARFLV